MVKNPSFHHTCVAVSEAGGGGPASELSVLADLFMAADG